MNKSTEELKAAKLRVDMAKKKAGKLDSVIQQKELDVEYARNFTKLAKERKYEVEKKLQKMKKKFGAVQGRVEKLNKKVGELEARITMMTALKEKPSGRPMEEILALASKIKALASYQGNCRSTMFVKMI